MIEATFFTVGKYLYKYNLTVLFVSPSKIAHEKFYIYCPPLLLNEIYAHDGQQQYSGRLWRLNNAQLVLRGPKCAKKIFPDHYTTTTSLNRWDKAGWIYAFMFFKSNSDPTIWMLQQKSRLIRPGNVFPVLCAIIMLSNQLLDMPYLWGGWIISAKVKCSLTHI